MAPEDGTSQSSVSSATCGHGGKPLTSLLPLGLLLCMEPGLDMFSRLFFKNQDFITRLSSSPIFPSFAN